MGGNGQALLMKLGINLALVVQVVSFCEAVALAEKGGVEREVAVDAMLKSVVASPVLGYRGPFILEGVPEVAWSDVHLQQKDMLLSLELARELGVAGWGRRQRDAERRPRARPCPQGLRRRLRGLPAARGDGVKPYRTRVSDVPLVGGLREDEGWIDMQVQFLIDAGDAGSDRLVVGRTVIPPGGRHDRHPNADEFLVVLAGRGRIYTDEGTERAEEGDVVFTPRGHWHGFDNTGDEDALLVWGWSGAGSLEAAGYEIP